MDASSASHKFGSRSFRDVLSTRGGTIAVAALAAIIAGILLFVFVQRYKSNQNSSSAATPVFVARSYIPAGTSANLIAAEGLLQRTTLRAGQIEVGAVSDPSALRGQVAAVSIYPGQQITTSDFTSTGSISSELSGSERALSIAIDSAHGLIGYVHAGDHVDVLASYPGSVTTLLQNILVLSAPGSTGGGLAATNNNGSFVLRVSESDAPRLAYAADNGKLWISLRPPLSANPSAAPTAPSTSSSSG